jgi:HAD superfamily hydrolase (TIGR01509 family)
MLFRLRVTTTSADSRCSRRRSAGGDGGTTLFRFASSDEDGGNLANIAASGASNQTQRDVRAVEKDGVGCAAVELDWVLFDADGVIQGARPGWMEKLTAWGGSRAEEFLLAIAAADVACLTGKDFGAAMREVLKQFDIHAPLEEVIDQDFWIEVRQPMLDAVRAVRDLGLHCGLATNQQNLRGTYMRSTLGFETIFDEQFYSFEVGFAKPDQGYFRAIIDRIGVTPDRVLFIDDHEGNVAGACEVGIHGELFPLDGGVAALTTILARYGVRL